MERIYDVLILGGGPAGYTAALYAARAGLRPLVTEKLSPGGQMALTGDVENYPGFEDGVDGFTLGVKMQKGAERFGAETRYAAALSVDFSNALKKVDTTDGALSAKTVILATGAVPRHLGLPGEAELAGKGVHYCAHCDGRFYKDKTVAVVGGGNSAVTDALYLSRCAKKVYLIHRRDVLRASGIYRDPLFSAKNVEFIPNSIVIELHGKDRLSGIKIKNVQNEETFEIACDGIFISIGRTPDSDFLNGAVRTDENGYIIASEDTKTNIDGVFAAGDVRTKELRQIVTAVADGATAAHYAEKYLNESNAF